MVLKSTILHKSLEQLPWLALILDEAMKVVCHLFSEALLVDQFLLYFFPRLFIEFVD